MRAAPHRWLIIAVFAPLAASACAGAGRQGAPAAEPGAASTGEIEALYRARADSARLRFSEADVRFMTDMVHHHAQALEIAALAPDRSSSTAVQTLAARIINAQQDEIATIRTWLRDRGQPVPELHVGPGGEVMVHGSEHTPGMPGMVPAERIRELERARGAAFDRLFLTLMIEHHAGAVTMVNDLFATDDALQDEAVFRFASDVQVDQATEIARMERMLAAMPGGRP